MASGGVASRIKRSVGDNYSNSSNSSHGTGGKAAARENDFLKYISIDFSSLEARFEQVFEKLEALETRMDLSSSLMSFAASPSPLVKATISEAEASQPSVSARSEAADGEGNSGSGHGGGDGKSVDLSGLAKEIESLRAAQLRLKIDQEVAQSSYVLSLSCLQCRL